MCSHYQALKDRAALERQFSVQSPPIAGVYDVWPGYQALFIRRPFEADVGDDAVPEREALAGVLSRYRLINVFGVGRDASYSNGTDLSCQRIKMVGRRQLAAALQHELAFADHVHQFDASQDIFGGSK